MFLCLYSSDNIRDFTGCDVPVMLRHNTRYVYKRYIVMTKMFPTYVVVLMKLLICAKI